VQTIWDYNPYHDNQFFDGGRTATSAVTVNPAGTTTLTGRVTITGTVQAGQRLVANTLALGGGAHISFIQWKRNGTNISGANGSIYTVQSADVGSNITVSVTRFSNSDSVTSAPAANSGYTVLGEAFLEGSINPISSYFILTQPNPIFDDLSIFYPTFDLPWDAPWIDRLELLEFIPRYNDWLPIVVRLGGINSALTLSWNQNVMGWYVGDNVIGFHGVGLRRRDLRFQLRLYN